jgi:hypothetical protein
MTVDKYYMIKLDNTYYISHESYCVKFGARAHARAYPDKDAAQGVLNSLKDTGITSAKIVTFTIEESK